MALFKSKKPALQTTANPTNSSAFAELALNYITDGVLLIDGNGVVKYTNPAAATMAGYGSPTNMIGLNYQFVLKLETAEGLPVDDAQSKLAQAIANNQAFTTREYLLISAQSERKAAISITLTPTGGPKADKIITFRDITKELEEESKQSEFISTASHEMRTPVASIEGYLGLALNPQTATIDERAHKYLTEAHNASQHLGHLFKDLLDVTKLDDGRLRVRLVPVEIVSLVQQIAADHQKDMVAKHLKYSFGTADVVNQEKKVEPLVYAAVDVDFLREILDNLIENAIKYTPDGGEIWVNCRGDGDKVLVNVTDTGIGVSAEDAGHIFQKFYRVDNSQTRSVGGTGLGLYIVKQRVEAMGGRVWVESAFGDGSTFFFSLPRLTDAEYKKRLLAYQNEQARQAFAKPQSGAVASIETVPTGPIAEMMKKAQAEKATAPVPLANAQATKPGAQTAGTVSTGVKTPNAVASGAQTTGAASAGVPIAGAQTAQPTQQAAPTKPALAPAGQAQPPTTTAPSAAASDMVAPTSPPATPTGPQAQPEQLQTQSQPPIPTPPASTPPVQTSSQAVQPSQNINQGVNQ